MPLTPLISNKLAASSEEGELEQSECLNTSALLPRWGLARSGGPQASAVVLAIMKAHGSTSLRARRHWRRMSKTTMENRLNMQWSTYDLIEDGTVDLGPWLLPAVEKILLD